MKLFLSVLLATGLILLQSAGSNAQNRKKINLSANFKIEQLAPGVWVAINNPQYGKAICNAGIIDLGDKTIVFDPFMTASAANELKVIAKQLTRKQVTLVVNSHHHSDHIRGSQVFLPQANIISTTTTRNEINRVERSEKEWENKFGAVLLEAVKKRSVNATASANEELPFWIGYYEGMIESSADLVTAVPDIVFDDSLWIEGSKMSVKLVERKNGHTASDAVLLIPKLGIAFMGDLLCNGRHPWLSEGNTHSWRQSLKLFYEDAAYTKYLPGYGEVCGKEELKILYQYLGDLQTVCDAAKTDSAQNALMNEPMPTAYRSWFCARFYQPNLQYLINTWKTSAAETLK